MTREQYIVRNCPCNVTTEDMCDWENTNETYCQDCTDCVIKQVIKECKWETNIDVNDRGDLAERVLSSFDIEEINK